MDYEPTQQDWNDWNDFVQSQGWDVDDVNDIDAVFSVKFFDSGEQNFDRYTAVYLNQPEAEGCFNSLEMSENPFQGIGFHGMAQLGEHLGKEISFKDLPEMCRKAVLQDLNYKGLSKTEPFDPLLDT